MNRNGPTRLVLIVSTKKSVVVSSTTETPKMPALLTRMSGRAAELPIDLLRSFLHALRVGHVARERNRSLQPLATSLSLASLRAIITTRTPIARQRRRDCRADPPRCARYYGSATASRSRQLDPLCASRRNSSRVLGSSRNAPLNAEVIVFEFCFCTPRIIMHRW